MRNTRLASSLAALLVSAAAVVCSPAVARAGIVCDCVPSGFDFNVDAKIDLIRSGPPGIRVDILDGTAVVNSGMFPNGGGSFVLKAVGTLNSDDNSDFISQGNGTARVTFVNAAGTGTAGTLFIADGGGAWQVVGVADVSGDGIDEIIFEGTGAATGAIRIANIASGSPVFSYLATGGGIWRYTLAANVNGDTSMDLMFRGTGVVNGLLRANLYGVAPIVRFYTQGGGAWILHSAGDLNNDGIDDLIDVADRPVSAHRIRIFDSTGIVYPIETGFVPTAGGAFVFRAVGDFNGDGNDDLGYDGASSFRIVPMIGISQGTSLYPSNGGGAFTLHRIADTNADGRADLISTNAAGDVRIQLSTEGGTITGPGLIANVGLTLF